MAWVMLRPYEDGVSVMLKFTHSFAISLASSAVGLAINAQLAYKMLNSQVTGDIVNVQ